MAPLRLPVPVGVKITLSAQVELGANVGGQVLVWEKSPAAWILPTFNVALPVLVRVRVCGVLEVPGD
jgi:hypothetical protein